MAGFLVYFDSVFLILTKELFRFFPGVGNRQQSAEAGESHHLFDRTGEPAQNELSIFTVTKTVTKCKNAHPGRIARIACREIDQNVLLSVFNGNYQLRFEIRRQ